MYPRAYAAQRRPVGLPPRQGRGRGKARSSDKESSASLQSRVEHCVVIMNPNANNNANRSKKHPSSIEKREGHLLPPAFLLANFLYGATITCCERAVRDGKTSESTQPPARLHVVVEWWWFYIGMIAKLEWKMKQVCGPTSILFVEQSWWSLDVSI